MSWRRDLDNEIMDGDGHGEREAVELLQKIGTDYTPVDEYRCRSCGRYFEMYEEEDPSYCPHCGAKQETVFTDELDEDGLYVI